MNLLRSLLIWLMLLFAAGATSAVAAPGADAAGEWISYRDAYRAMLWFEKYGQPKHLIQAHFRLAQSGAMASGTLVNATPVAAALPAQLTLSSKSVRVNLTLDETGRTHLPMLKAAYDENAELQLPQKIPDLNFAAEISIMIRADGIYNLADLRAACQQVLAYQNWRDASLLRGKKCSGVRFVYAKKNAPSSLAVRRGDPALSAQLNAPPALTLSDGAAFWHASEAPVFRVANVLFATLPDKGQVLTPSAPLAISALFE